MRERLALSLSGQDIVDQSAGTTAFVHDYLHVNWDGSEVQNDEPTANVHGVASAQGRVPGIPVRGLGVMPRDVVLG